MHWWVQGQETFTCHCPRRVPGAQGRMTSFGRISESVRGGGVIFKKITCVSLPFIRGQQTMSQILLTTCFYNESFIRTQPWQFDFVFSMAALERAELSRCDRDHMTHEVKNIYYLSFNSKRLSPPALDTSWESLHKEPPWLNNVLFLSVVKARFVCPYFGCQEWRFQK